jgi:hypothetical protein
MLRVTDYLLGPPRVSDAHIATLLGKLDGPDAKDQQFIMLLRHYCEVAGVDDANAISQVIWETDSLRAPRWNRDLNPAGIGITGDETAQPFTIANVDEAARLFVQCIYSMVKKAWHPGVPIPEKARSWMDGIWLKKVRHPLYPKGVEQVNDQHIIYYIDGDMKATWAADAAYMGHVQRFNAMIPGVPDQSSVTLPTEPEPEEPTMPETIVFGRVPRPPMTVRLAKKYGDGHGYTQLSAPRRLVGACDHITDGYGSLDFYADFFSIGGEREADALVDFVIDRSGGCIMLNDPFGTRSPWANGRADGLEGDGVAFVNTLGLNAVNDRLASIEHVGVSPDAMTAPQLERSAQLKAWLFDQGKVPYTTFPVNPNVGIVTHLQHFEFATKPCPGPGIRAQTAQLQARIIEIMKQFQLAETPAPPPDPAPEPPVSIYPPGMTLQLAKRLYGTHRESWASKPFTFDPTRSECKQWLSWGIEQLEPGQDYTHAEWPKLDAVIRRGATKNIHVYAYSNGKVFEKSVREDTPTKDAA